MEQKYTKGKTGDIQAKYFQMKSSWAISRVKMGLVSIDLETVPCLHH
jgi:hypothetical protein